GFEVCVKREARNIVEERCYDDKGNGVAEGKPARLHVAPKHLFGFGEHAMRGRNQRKRWFHRVEKLDGGLSMDAVSEQSNCFTDNVPGGKTSGSAGRDSALVIHPLDGSTGRVVPGRRKRNPCRKKHGQLGSSNNPFGAIEVFLDVTRNIGLTALQPFFRKLSSQFQELSCGFACLRSGCHRPELRHRLPPDRNLPLCHCILSHLPYP